MGILTSDTRPHSQIAYGDVVAGGTVSVAQTGGAVVNGTNLTLMQNRLLPKKAQISWSSGGSGKTMQIRCDFGSTKKIRFAALLGITVSSVHSYLARLRLFSGVFATEIYTGSYVSSRVSQPVASVPAQEFFDATQASEAHFSARSMIIEFDMLFMPTSGTMDIGRLWASRSVVFRDGFKFGWSIDTLDPSLKGRTPDDVVLADRRPRCRVFSGTVERINVATAYGLGAADPEASIMDLAFTAGLTEEVIAFPYAPGFSDDSNSSNFHYTGVYGLLGEPLELKHMGGDQFDVPRIRVVECPDNI
jgi:hypothetical protein